MLRGNLSKDLRLKRKVHIFLVLNAGAMNGVKTKAILQSSSGSSSLWAAHQKKVQAIHIRVLRSEVDLGTHILDTERKATGRNESLQFWDDKNKTDQHKEVNTLHMIA